MGPGAALYARASALLSLAVIVGVSEDEQLAPVHEEIRAYQLRAAAASVLIIVIGLALMRMSRQLAIIKAREVEERIAHASQVEYLAYHDGLSGLPNRSFFSKLLEQGIAQARRNQRQLAVMFLDLDRFKYINDTLGHEAGDDLLKQVAERLKNCLRESDTVARLGGDEFVALIGDLSDDKYVASVAQKSSPHCRGLSCCSGRSFESPRASASASIHRTARTSRA